MKHLKLLKAQNVKVPRSLGPISTSHFEPFLPEISKGVQAYIYYCLAQKVGESRPIW